MIAGGMFNDNALAFLLYATFLPKTGTGSPDPDDHISNPAASAIAVNRLVEPSITEK